MTDEALEARQPPREVWSRTQALAMLTAVLACQYRQAAWPVAAVAAPCFAGFIVASRRTFTPSGRFGLANAVTCSRLVAVLCLAAPPPWLSNGALVALTIGILLLDGLDGWLARRRAEASVFGAHFDMETDALFVLMVTLRLWLVTGYGPWVLLAGLLRYGYVLSLWLLPGTGREAPRSLLGRSAFLILILGLIGGLSLPGAYGLCCVALGTLTVSLSFARSFYFSHFAN
jgi:phosphatidylglycerophosphate synthase